MDNPSVKLPGDLYKQDMDNIRKSNPIFASQEKRIREKELSMLRKQKEYKLLSQKVLFKNMQIQDRKVYNRLKKQFKF